MSNYFDLNSRMEKAYNVNMGGNRVRRRIDSSVEKDKNSSEESNENPHKMSIYQQIIMYLGIVLGVIFSSSVMNYTNSGIIDFNLSLGTMVISFLVGLFVMPYIYEKVIFVGKFDLIQFSLFFQNGVLWQVIATAIQSIR